MGRGHICVFSKPWSLFFFCWNLRRKNSPDVFFILILYCTYENFFCIVMYLSLYQKYRKEEPEEREFTWLHYERVGYDGLQYNNRSSCCFSSLLSPPTFFLSLSSFHFHSLSLSLSTRRHHARRRLIKYNKRIHHR